MSFLNERFILQELPPAVDLETKPILRQASVANRYLAELKGISKTIPNQNILINTLPLLEAKDSSAVENIITTHDELYKESVFSEYQSNPAAKEVQNYSQALRLGYQTIKEKKLLTNNQITEIQCSLEKNQAGFRTQAGTILKNTLTNETIYTPPQDHNDIIRLMLNLEQYINDDSISNVDPLIKMAVIHFQFESIHPFYDGNGRTGRIINILYLVYKGLLDIPVLYLSSYIIKNKHLYYQHLQNVRNNKEWEKWVLFMLKGIEETAQETVFLISEIRELMSRYKHQIRDKYKFYSQELLNNLFSHPYTKIEFLERDLSIHRGTAAKYLKTLTNDGFLRIEKINKHHYYINEPLLKLFVTRNQIS